jgi:hypothetical protein
MKEAIVIKKHFICTHPWASESAQKDFLHQSKDMTDRQVFDAIKTEKAELLVHWMGKEDFFYCHWYAQDEEAIFQAIDILCFNDIMVSTPNEMQRVVSSNAFTDEAMINPDGA